MLPVLPDRFETAADMTYIKRPRFPAVLVCKTHQWTGQTDSMAGEYDVARVCLAQAFAQVEKSAGMTQDGMAEALMVTLITHMLKRRKRKDLASFIDYQLDACSEDEHVITRGC